MERFNPRNDYLFLKIMGEPGDEEQGLAFLNAVLSDAREHPLRLVKILENRSLSAESLGDKASVLDVLKMLGLCIGASNSAGPGAALKRGIYGV
ncbi:MAG: Rpn family recombination-promoting nuclease/putative transposase [Treponema sp.]|jgi:hypothetical protein|nr:Rpn family recombination-promoting nuclease/putative transposase [Treponema sp.]